MTFILSALCVFLSIVVIFLVLMHSGKDAGLSGAFGVGTGQGSLGGGSLVERNLNRWTVALSIAWIVVILLLVIKPYERPEAAASPGGAVQLLELPRTRGRRRQRQLGALGRRLRARGQHVLRDADVAQARRAGERGEAPGDDVDRLAQELLERADLLAQRRAAARRS